MARDFFNELYELTKKYNCTVNEFFTTNPLYCGEDLENHSDSYKYIPLKIEDKYRENLEDLSPLNNGEFPNDLLAGILLKVLKNKLPSEVEMQSLGIYRDGTQFYFCISGAISSEELQKVGERFGCPFDYKPKNEIEK